MKKKILFIILFISILITRVKAVCNNTELNDLAEKFEVTYTEDTAPKIVSIEGHVTELEKEWAYFLVFSPYSDKITIKVTNSLKKDEGDAVYNETLKTNVFGSYIHFDPKEYTIKLYGSKDSACPNELLKTVKFNVPKFNTYSLYEYCAENPNMEFCSMMKDTSKVSKEEFKKEAEKQEEKKKEENMNIVEKSHQYILRYGLFILIPILLITGYYLIRMNQYKKKVREQ